jgi:hypothetical protein
MAYPTAVQAVVDGHDPPRISLYGSPVGVGVGWMLQLMPFQRPAFGRSPVGPCGAGNSFAVLSAPVRSGP